MPTIADSHTTDGTGTGTFTSSITGLTPNTTYYVRAYATNSVGTAYGEELSFTTMPTGAINGLFSVSDTILSRTILRSTCSSMTSAGKVR